MSLVQVLESRRLFAITITDLPQALPDDPTPVSVKLSKTGTLQVTGSSQKDKIVISRDPKTGAAIVKVPSSDSVSQGNYGVLKTGGFDSKLVKRIKVDGGGGGDVIEYQISEKFVSATLNGGKGDDRITSQGRRTVLVGGSGNDTLTSHQSVYYTIGQGGAVVTTDLISPTFQFRGGEFRLGDVASRAHLTRSQFELTNTKATRLAFNDGRATIVSGTTNWSSSSDLTAINTDGLFQVVNFARSPMGGLVASGNRLEGGDGDDTFITFGTEDSIIGGNGNDRYAAPASGVDVYEDVALTPITPSKDLLTIRSRLFASGVENVTTNVDKSRGSVSVNAGTLADIA